MVRWVSALGWLVLVLPGAVAAGDERRSEITGEWRWVYSHQQPFPLEAAGTPSPLGWFLDQRLRAGAEQPVGKQMAFGAEVEFLAGQVAGDQDPLGAELRPDERTTLRGWDLERLEVRQLWLAWHAPWFLLKAGQMGSHWGMGLLANDGRAQPGRFDVVGAGDLSDRVLLATRPFARAWPDSPAADLIAALGGGLVYRDENGALPSADLGAEILGSLLWRHPPWEAGLYVAGRLQSDADGDRLDVAVIDLYAAYAPPASDSGPTAALEAALIAGRTDRVRQVERPEGVDVLAFGAALRAGWRFDFWGLEPELEFGYASGDADPHDGTVTSFSFDPNYRVGLVLFDCVLRGISAAAAAEASDPARVGEPLPGVDQLPTAGRVSGALYLYPNLRLRPIEHLTLLAGLLWARSSAPFGQSYQTFLHGGVATNPYGVESPSRELGLEADLGAEWTQPLWQDLRLVVGLQAGWWFPGAAFERPDGTRPGVVARVLSRAALEW